MVCDIVDPFSFFFLLVRKVCHVGWVPLLCVKKIEPQNLSRKKKVSESPPPRSSAFFGTCTTFGAGGGPEKKCVSPPQSASDWRP